MTITLPYSPASIPTGYTPASLTISYFNGTQWVTLTPTAVDTVNDTITVVTNHFSWWAVTVRDHTPTPLPTSLPGGGNNFVAYPNPARGSQVKIYVPMRILGAADLKIQIYSASLRMVREVTIPQAVPGSAVTLDLLDKAGIQLANGFYYVMVTPAGGTRSMVKLLVTR